MPNNPFHIKASRPRIVSFGTYLSGLNNSRCERRAFPFLYNKTCCFCFVAFTTESEIMSSFFFVSVEETRRKQGRIT